MIKLNINKVFFIVLIFVIFSVYSCRSKKIGTEEVKTYIQTNENIGGTEVTIRFQKGESHNHPSFVIWIEDTSDKYIETLFITQSVATGYFNYGKVENGKWISAEKRYPESLPYWGHKRGVIAEDGYYTPDSKTHLPDAITSATPKGSFELTTKIKEPQLSKFNILLEINQTWDFNEYWTNNKFPDNEAYKRSCQPALVYSATIDLSNPEVEYELKPIGHSHYAGETGELFEDLSTVTTALHIAERITVKVNL